MCDIDLNELNQLLKESGEVRTHPWDPVQTKETERMSEEKENQDPVPAELQRRAQKRPKTRAFPAELPGSKKLVQKLTMIKLKSHDSGSKYRASPKSSKMVISV